MTCAPWGVWDWLKRAWALCLYLYSCCFFNFYFNPNSNKMSFHVFIFFSHKKKDKDTIWFPNSSWEPLNVSGPGSCMFGSVFLSVTLAEQRCDTISPGVYPSLQPFARRLLWTMHFLWAAQPILDHLHVSPQTSKIVHYGLVKSKLHLHECIYPSTHPARRRRVHPNSAQNKVGLL